MKDDAQDPPDDASIERALKCLPRGTFAVTARDERGRPLAFVATFAMQVSGSPPKIAVALSKASDALAAVRAERRFGFAVLDAEPGSDIAAELDGRGPGSPALPCARTFLDCRLAGEHNAGDHVVVFGAVEVVKNGPGHHGIESHGRSR